MGQEIRCEVIKKHLGINKEKIEFVDHHYCHSLYAYFSGPLNLKDSTVITLDAYGDNQNFTCYTYKRKNSTIKINKILSSNKSVIARLYRYITLILRMKPSQHEYKVMGLAPYAKTYYTEEVYNEFLKIQKFHKLKFTKKKIKDLYFSVYEIVKKHRFDSIAGALQRYAETMVLTVLGDCVRKTKLKNLCYSGGVAMNVKANMMFTQKKITKNFYIPPVPDDTAHAIGACYYSYQKKTKLCPDKLENAYLGYEINDQEALENIKKFQLNKKFQIQYRNIIPSISKMLISNKIIARASGKAEFGARALGNRSIFCNPKNFSNRDIINEKIKNRDFWMPFAASVIDKYASKYFQLDQPLEYYKYMTNCLETKNLGKAYYQLQYIHMIKHVDHKF